jgi:DNA-binding MarR family transcriptional regulator
MDGQVNEEDLNTQVMDALIELLKHLGNLGQSIGTAFGLTGSDAIALHKIDGPMPMKELGLRMGCDASFVTVIVDSLEKHGLARREPSQRDRRSKNIVLTDHGIQVREQVMKEVTARMPWGNALDITERECFLGLLQKMIDQVKGGDRVTPAPAATS